MSFNLVEASISDLQSALSSRSITSVELVSRYLHRIARYDIRGPCLNSIPVLNLAVFDEAAASDARRAVGQTLGPLDGIPYTLKDSMKYRGMSCATGSPAFADLLADRDCFVASQLRKAGAVCMGRTNTPPMMASGMHRGLYGRAESPYNPEYLTAAFSSGSSNGSATSTAASFAAFGLGSETVSSGRSPASNNGLVAYTPSRGVLSPRGIWPLYPTCDVLVPHARSVEDMLRMIDVLAVEDPNAEGDFWREQTFVEIPRVPRPESYLDLLSGAKDSLHGKTIAVPRMYIGLHDPKAKLTVVCKDVVALWQKARIELESLGAKVIETNFPLVTKYEDDSISGHPNNVVGFTPDWNGKERGELVAYLWDDFIKDCHDPGYPGLAAVDGSKMFPRPDGYLPDKFMETKNFIDYAGVPDLVRHRGKKSIWDIDGIKEALPALEAQRKRDLEDWMDQEAIDLVVFPANGDVGKADLDTSEESARHALQNGVKYSNGNRAIRHMGVPTVTVSMGLMATSKMPVGLTFAGKSAQDSALLQHAYAFEQQTKNRVAPPVTQPLSSDTVQLRNATPASGRAPELAVQTAMRIEAKSIGVAGTVSPANAQIQVFVDGQAVEAERINSRDGTWSAEGNFTPFEPPTPLYGGVGLVVDKVMVVVLARSDGAVAGKLVLID